MWSLVPAHRSKEAAGGGDGKGEGARQGEEAGCGVLTDLSGVLGLT